MRLGTAIATQTRDEMGLLSFEIVIILASVLVLVTYMLKEYMQIPSVSIDVAVTTAVWLDRSGVE